MNYKQKIIEMIQKIEDENILRKIYTVVKTYYNWIIKKGE